MGTRRRTPTAPRYRQGTTGPPPEQAAINVLFIYCIERGTCISPSISNMVASVFVELSYLLNCHTCLTSVCVEKSHVLPNTIEPYFFEQGDINMSAMSNFQNLDPGAFTMEIKILSAEEMRSDNKAGQRMTRQEVEALRAPDGKVYLPGIAGEFREFDPRQIPEGGGVTVSGKIDSSSELGKAVYKMAMETNPEFVEIAKRLAKRPG
jgi:hypothetical protein